MKRRNHLPRPPKHKPDHPPVFAYRPRLIRIEQAINTYYGAIEALTAALQDKKRGRSDRGPGLTLSEIDAVLEIAVECALDAVTTLKAMMTYESAYVFGGGAQLPHYGDMLAYAEWKRGQIEDEAELLIWHIGKHGPRRYWQSRITPASLARIDQVLACCAMLDDAEPSIQQSYLLLSRE